MRALNASLVFYALLLLVSCSSAPKLNLAEDKYQISEITLERSGSWGVKSGYRLVLWKDGTAEYVGDIHAKRKGKYHGKVSTEQFGQLTKLIVENGFFSLENKYQAQVADGDTIKTSVVYAGGRKTVEDYGRGGGERLTKIEQMLDNTAEQIVWIKDDS